MIGKPCVHSKFKATKIKSDGKENNDLRNILNDTSKTNLTENIEIVKTILSSQRTFHALIMTMIIMITNNNDNDNDNKIISIMGT